MQMPTGRKNYGSEIDLIEKDEAFPDNDLIAKELNKFLRVPCLH